MGLANYCTACFNLASELRNSLEANEVEALHSALKGRKVIDWVKWRNAHDDLVFDFVASTPKERTKKKFREWRLHLTMAGIQHCLEAHAVLSVATLPELTPSGSYRDMTALAGNAYWKLFEHEIPNWPFPNYESPFIDDPLSDHKP